MICDNATQNASIYRDLAAATSGLASSSKPKPDVSSAVSVLSSSPTTSVTSTTIRPPPPLPSSSATTTDGDGGSFLGSLLNILIDDALAGGGGDAGAGSVIGGGSSSSNQHPSSSSNQNLNNNNKPSANAPPSPPRFDECGKATFPTFRIVGGDESRPGQWPWMAAIFLHGPQRTEFWCGGTLISQFHVLTAAHCTKDARQNRSKEFSRCDDILPYYLHASISFNSRQFTVRVGDHDLFNAAEAAKPDTFSVVEFRVHPRFNGNGFYNDIAIFKLDRRVTFNEFVRPICLPTSNMLVDDFVGQTPSVVGWGSTYYGGQEATHLRDIELPVWKNADCDKAYFQPIGNNFLCAGFADGGKDACQGDSGGPLLLLKNAHWYQIGIVSFGNRCAEPGYPGVYTRITEFMDWIRANVN
ncbi:unnamed protein product [Notodromas monacha]|uniref:Peptidase S1 domain-containing protein n=1 Tax=Notodromas monacha TaxID=399045 RepID=A0A7R9GDX3_9CRUS|nr:unnamed protein product [Notodromas monacha]CAG0919163.1 unnamed protein product [Notodromas monacha]